jgi:signal transduction histidine kinase
VNLKVKLILVFVALALVPLLVVSVLNYRSGVSAVETLLRARAAERASRMTRRVERSLDSQAARLVEMSREESLRKYVNESQMGGAGIAAAGVGVTRLTKPEVPDTVRAHFTAFFKNNRERLESVTCLDASGVPLFRLLETRGGGDEEVNFQTSDFVSSEVNYDKRVWSDGKALRSTIAEKPSGATFYITVPVFEPMVGLNVPPSGAVVAEVRLEGVIADAAGDETPGTEAQDGTTPASRSEVVALNNATDTVAYHTNTAFSHRAASSVLPDFAPVAAQMKSGAEGSDFYEGTDGDRRLAAFRQVKDLGLSLAAVENYTAAVGPVRRTGLFGIALALVAGLGALALVLVIARREARAVESVERVASAIAAGDLGQRIDVSQSGETRELAESFNRMSERLREMIAREAEARQFQSFLRISAMISHDLKNAIAGLSMLVSNMERQFHREEFRADAIESLREATEKLKRTVARLSEPAKSMSGEYRMASRQIDLVPIIRHVIATDAEPSRPLYDIETRLPETLVATVEPERFESVVENLVINALEAMGAKGGRLTVEAGALEGELVFLSVADTGIGMSEDFIKTRLFRPFSTTKNKGIGLGLFTCKEIVEAHGGRFEVESHVGVGTRFRVVLPSRLFRSGERQKQAEKASAAGKTSGPSASD